MPDIKISNMDDAELPLAGDELVPLVQNGFNVKCTVADLPAGGDASILMEAGESSSMISAMSVAATPLTGTELLPLIQGGSNVQGSVDDILTKVTPSILMESGASEKISTMTAASLPITGAELVPILKAGLNRHVAVTDLFDSVSGGLAFTPILSFGGASVGITYTDQTGFYSRAFNLIVATIHINLSSKGTSVGAAVISGLPLNSGALFIGSAPIFMRSNFNAAIVAGGMAQLDQNSSSMPLLKYSAGGMTPMADTDFTNLSNLRLTMIYSL